MAEDFLSSFLGVPLFRTGERGTGGRLAGEDIDVRLAQAGGVSGTSQPSNGPLGVHSLV